MKSKKHSRKNSDKLILAQKKNKNKDQKAVKQVQDKVVQMINKRIEFG
jgi:hypothetical protein